jgi:glycosyltransferase involved in cell wall biosynthesis
MNVLAVTNFYPPHHGGGYGLQCQWFCEGLAARGHSVQVLTSQPETVALPQIGTLPVERALRLLPAELPARKLLAATINNVRAVKQSIRKSRPDVMLCAGMDGVGFNTYHAAVSASRPSLSWLGDTWLGQAWRNLTRYDRWVDLASGGQRGGLARVVKRVVGRYGRVRGLFSDPKPAQLPPVAAISHFVLEDLRQSGAPVPADAPVVPITLAPDFFTTAGDPIGPSGQRSPHLRALFVGRMEWPKGPDVALDSVAYAVQRGADVRLTFAGIHIEQLRPALEQLAAEKGIADRITWAGTPPLSDLIDLYRSHDVFLFPSRIVEGLGVVNCEAMACGLPILGTAHSGSAEVILDDRTGYRVAKDDPESMGRHLAELHTDRERLKRLSGSAIEFSRRFHPDQVIKELDTALNWAVCQHESEKQR